MMKGNKFMKNKYLYAVLGIVIIVVLIFVIKIGIFKNAGISVLNGDKVQVTVSFFPLAEFAREIGGNKVEVINLTPAGVEPHDFEPRPQDLVMVRNSSLFIYNGAGFEPWVEKTLPDLEDSKTVIVDSSKGISLLAGSEEEHEGEKADEHEEESLFDPHVWLDPILASKQVDNILAGLIKTDPENKSFYEANAEGYKQKLAQLDRDYKSGLASCTSRDVITSHNAFAYLAGRYNLTITPITGISPDEEPSPKRLAEIADFARANNVKYIFFETLVSPSLSQTIANEVGAQTLVFNPLEGLTDKEIAQGEDYLSVQRQNLANLKIALNCK
jgi:zinc transport system substrate-binding protein